MTTDRRSLIFVRSPGAAPADTCRNVRSGLLTGSYRIKGYIDLIPGARVTDFMTGAKDFVAVMDAEVYESEVAGRQVLVAPFIDVNRNHIEIITLG